MSWPSLNTACIAHAVGSPLSLANWWRSAPTLPDTSQPGAASSMGGHGHERGKHDLPRRHHRCTRPVWETAGNSPCTLTGSASAVIGRIIFHPITTEQQSFTEVKLFGDRLKNSTINLRNELFHGEPPTAPHARSHGHLSLYVNVTTNPTRRTTRSVVWLQWITKRTCAVDGTRTASDDIVSGYPPRPGGTRTCCLASLGRGSEKFYATSQQ